MVVLLPEEYKLRVGGMSATELRQQLGKYWGQGGILGSDVEEGYQVMRVPVGADLYHLNSDTGNDLFNLTA